MPGLWRGLALAWLMAGATTAFADEPLTLDLTIRDHRFEPAELKVPAGKPFVIRVKNLDPIAEEFDSVALKSRK